MQIAAMIRRDRPWPADTRQLDEVVIRSGGRTHWHCLAVDAYGEVLNILVQPRHDELWREYS